MCVSRRSRRCNIAFCSALTASSYSICETSLALSLRSRSSSAKKAAFCAFRLATYSLVCRARVDTTREKSERVCRAHMCGYGTYRCLCLLRGVELERWVNVSHLISVLGFSCEQSRSFVTFLSQFLIDQSRMLRFQTSHLWFGVSSACRHNKREEQRARVSCTSVWVWNIWPFVIAQRGGGRMLGNMAVCACSEGWR